MQKTVRAILVKPNIFRYENKLDNRMMKQFLKSVFAKKIVICPFNVLQINYLALTNHDSLFNLDQELLYTDLTAKIMSIALLHHLRQVL